MKKTSILACLMMAFVCHSTYAQLIAFPGAEGFGKYSTGGRGGKVVEVTNLNDSGEGSFRWALDQYVDTFYVYKDAANPSVQITSYQPLTIVFKVSGVINLLSDIKIKRDNLTVAGQTAPCDGICFTGRSILLNGATGAQLFYWGPRRKNVIFRYLRFRPGIPKDANGTPTSSFVTYGLDVENYENVIVDHCSISWANEECLATYDTKNITFQWNIVSEGLYSAYHPKGLRSYGGVWGGQYATYHHNLLANQNNRTPRYNGSRAHDTLALIEYSNNVNYNWGSSSAPYGGEVEILGGISRVNILNNYYKPGPATPSTLKIVRPDYTSVNGVGRWHVEGNIVDGNAQRTADNWLAVDFASIPVASRDSARSDSLFTIALPVDLKTAQQAYDSVLAYVGAIYPKRDTVDRRIVNEVKTKTAAGTGTANKAGIIDDPAVVGGVPAFEQCSVSDDTDHDGMPDFWENDNGLNYLDPEDRNNIDPTTGYTMLELYLNNLAAGFKPVPARLLSFDALQKNSTVTLNWVMANEINNKGFYIERAVTNSNNWESLGFVDGKGANAGNNKYNFIDNNATGISYQYRLKQVDITGNISYSKIIVVRKASAVNVTINIAPNPAQTFTNLSYTIPQSSWIKMIVYNAKGQLIETLLNERVAAGNYQKILNTEKYSSGKYIIQLLVDREKYSSSFYKTN